MNRFSQFYFRQGKTARNRVVVPPMASQTADSAGNATSVTVQHYERLAASGAGIVFAEYSHVHPSGKGELNQLGAFADGQIAGLCRISSVIKRSGALAGLQLVHTGGKSTREIAGGELQSPSGVRVPVKGWTPDESVAMTGKQIQLWKEWFVAGAARASLAGFDIAELHAAHGYGLNQWLSPLTNKRTDGYGGSIAGRSRILIEIAGAIRRLHPELLLAVRLPAQDHMDGGLTVDEMGFVVAELERAGGDLIDVSSGIGGWRRPEGRSGEGYLVGDATALKSFTRLPVIGVGGIETGAFIDKAVGERRLDFAAVGRAILSGPREWGSINLDFNNTTELRGIV